MADNAQTAALLVRSGKGILAADESVPAMNARLAGAGVAGTTVRPTRRVTRWR